MDSLTSRLRAETTALHRMAERSGIMVRLLKGTADRVSYAAFLAALLPIYRALEAGLVAHRHHPQVGPICFPGLARSESLAADLAAFGGAGGVGPVSAAERYADRVRTVGEDRPFLLAAHSYVRYLGDLSGGQILGPVVGRCFGLVGGVGTSFYRFDAIDDPEQFKARYRAALDGLPLSEAEQDDVVAEAKRSFELNIEVFNAVSPAADGSSSN